MLQIFFKISAFHDIIRQLFLYVVFCSQGIEKVAWDDSGERLAVSYKGGHDIYKGLIAVYDVRRSPLISVSLM